MFWLLCCWNFPKPFGCFSHPGLGISSPRHIGNTGITGEGCNAPNLLYSLKRRDSSSVFAHSKGLQVLWNRLCFFLNIAEYAASTRSNASAARTARYNSSTLFIPIFEFLPKDKWNGAVLHCVEYSWRLRWNERLMKDLYPLGLLTSPMTSGISWSWFGKSGMKVKMFNLAVRCTGCGCRCSAVSFFRLIQNNTTGVEMIKYLFSSQGLTTSSTSPQGWKRTKKKKKNHHF